MGSQLTIRLSLRARTTRVCPKCAHISQEIGARAGSIWRGIVTFFCTRYTFSHLGEILTHLTINGFITTVSVFVQLAHDWWIWIGSSRNAPPTRPDRIRKRWPGDARRDEQRKRPELLALWPDGLPVNFVLHSWNVGIVSGVHCCVVRFWFVFYLFFHQ